jgi:superfamily II DNA or RNA helicase
MNSMASSDGDITISKIDEVWLRVSCREASIAMEMSDYFTFAVPNARFLPAYRHKVWDGKIRLYNAYSQKLYAGLLSYIFTFAKERNYRVAFAQKLNFDDPHAKNLTIDSAMQFLQSLNAHAGGNPLIPLEHQVQAVYHAVRSQRTLLLSPTGSGKSFISYALARYYAGLMPMLDQNLNNKKVLIVVPTVGLVHQLASDFADYSSHNGWSVDTNCHRIFTGREKGSDKPIVITTWQSIYKLPIQYFSQFGMVNIDEAHQMKANSIKAIMEKLVECPFRFGMTGTLDGMQTNKLVLEGLTGKVHRVATSRGLIEAGILSRIEIQCITLTHPKSVIKQCKKYTYDEEIDFLVSNPARNEFICKLALASSGNTLILFQYVEKHGQVLHRMLQQLNSDSSRPIFFVSGEVDAELRENIRKIVEQEKNAIIVASYGTFSTGINIRRLHNVIFAHPSKGRVRVLQSIGRQLRKSADKDMARLYDISDNLCHKSHVNYGIKHQIERIKLYAEEQYPYKMVNIKMPGD